VTGSRRRPGAEGSDDKADGTAGEKGAAPANPFLEMMSAFRGLSEAGMTSLGMATSVGQAQLEAANAAAAAMAQLPLATLEQSSRELARVREAVHLTQAQLAVFDEQLAALEAMLEPLRRWAELWNRPGPSSAPSP
jgi:hypothetical protein